jgi:uncharacterized protein
MASAVSEEQVRVPTLVASWLEMTFVHWRIPAERLQPLLPPGLIVDEYEGSGWVGLTPFLMADLRPFGLPGAAVPRRMLSAIAADLRLPGRFDASRTLETNLRTYVRGPDGRDGLWFLTLEVGNPLLALGVRWTVGAPYHAARLHLGHTGNLVTYAGRRRHGPRYDVAVRSGEQIDPAGLDVWLTGRWRAYTTRGRQLLVTPVQHEPWPLQVAHLEHLEQTFADRLDLGQLTGEPLVHFSRGVRHVRIGVPRVVPSHNDEQ